MKKILYLALLSAVVMMTASCGNTAKQNGSAPNDSSDSTGEVIENEEIAAVSGDTVPVSSDDTKAIMQLIFKAYYDPMLTAETERIYSSTMLDRFKELGISGEISRTDLMSNDLKGVWNSFNQLDPEVIMEFLDWDLFYCGQDIYELQVTVDKIDFESDNRAEATVKVVNSGQLSPVSFKLVKDKSGLWLFDDITWKNAAEYVKEPMRAYAKAHK